MDTSKPFKLTDPLGVAAGRFCTMVNVGHTAEFFALDMRALTPEGEACLLGRFFLTPQHTKRLASLLTQHVATFEKEHGELKVSVPPPPAAESN
jgi:hypothetical protein